MLFYFSSKFKFVVYKATKVETFFALSLIKENIYNILGDKDLKSVLEALPADLGRLDDDRSLLQAYEINTK